MKHIKQIFLDLDGPLLDGKKRHYQCYRSILESNGFKYIDIDEYWEKKRSLINHKDLLRLSGAGTIYNNFITTWLEMIELPDMLALDKVQDGAIDCLRNWRDQGIELILITMRKNKCTLEEQLVSTGLREYLDVVLASGYSDGGEGKADVVRKHYSAEQLEKYSLWIGDTEADLIAAQSLRCDVVLISNGLRNEEYLNSLGNARVLSSIALLKNL